MIQEQYSVYPKGVIVSYNGNVLLTLISCYPPHLGFVLGHCKYLNRGCPYDLSLHSREADEHFGLN